MSDPLITKLENGILTLTMNMAGARNPLSQAMIAALQNALDVAAGDKLTRIIVLAANGPAFCAGHDLKEITRVRENPDAGLAYFTQLMADCSKLMQTIVAHPCPVIAMIDGVAAAAGCQLVATCDLAVASARAKFTTPGVHIGLFCSTPMVALSRNVAHKHAMEMLLTGDMIEAEKAEQIGLVNKVVDPDELKSVTLAMAAKIASKSAMTLKTGKAAFYQQSEMGLARAYEYASSVMVENMMKNDAREGIGAFVEKRDPEWSHS